MSHFIRILRSENLKRWKRWKSRFGTTQYAAQTERLERRVRVLERIITDRGLALSDEIDGLRAFDAAPTRIEH